MPDQSARPRQLTIAFWLLVVGAMLLLLGGMLSASTSFETLRQVADNADAAAGSGHRTTDDMLRDVLTLYRVTGVFAMVVGVVLAFVADKTRSGDPRFRRATLGLAIAAVVLIAMFNIVVLNLLTVVALIPIAVAAVLLTRPAVREWFDGSSARGADGESGLESANG